MMDTVSSLFALAAGHGLPEHDGPQRTGPARAWQIAVLALLASVAFAAVFGLAAGSASAALALRDVYKLPMVVMLSALLALPAGLLTWKLFDTRNRIVDLVVGIAAGTLATTLVLAAIAPLVALYYHTSAFAGPALVMLACALAAVFGFYVLCRTTLAAAAPDVRRHAVFVPLAIVMVMQAASAVQLVEVSSPILPHATVFRGGLDGLMGR